MGRMLQALFRRQASAGLEVKILSRHFALWWPCYLLAFACLCVVVGVTL